MTVYPPPSAPVNRVRVTAEDHDSPHPIAPPTQIEEQRRVVVSPPLHSHKMDEHENPFKPDEILYHEVDPIVEQYLHKPFPPSLPGSAQGTPVKHLNGHASPEEVKPRLQEKLENEPVASQSPPYYQNGLSRSDLGVDEDKLKGHNESSQPLIDAADREPHHQNGKTTDGEIPPPNQVEIVHMKKKKCGCCSLQ